LVGNCTINQRSNGAFDSTFALAASYAQGNADATRIWLRMIHTLACGIISLVNVLDPEVVIIGGGISTAGNALFHPLEEEMNKLEWRPNGQRVKIVPAQLGEYAGAYGAAWNAMREESA
jgi:glucokinase